MTFCCSAFDVPNSTRSVPTHSMNPPPPPPSFLCIQVWGMSPTLKRARRVLWTQTHRYYGREDGPCGLVMVGNLQPES